MKCVNCDKQTVCSTIVGIAKIPVCTDCYKQLNDKQLQKLVQNTKGE